MAKENIQKVIELIGEKTELQDRLAQAADAESYKTVALAIAEENGLPVTSEEYDEAAAKFTTEETKELSDAELEAVAGGASGIVPLTMMTCNGGYGKPCTGLTTKPGCKLPGGNR